jgi:hypothetical protein
MTIISILPSKVLLTSDLFKIKTKLILLKKIMVLVQNYYTNLDLFYSFLVK